MQEEAYKSPFGEYTLIVRGISFEKAKELAELGGSMVWGVTEAGDYFAYPLESAQPCEITTSKVSHTIPGI